MINIYSKSDSELGRLLSNFARTPFEKNGHRFESVEGWWYWYTTGKQYEHLKSLYGWKAKEEGRKYPRVNEVTPEVLANVYRVKLECNPKVLSMLLGYGGEFDHYYIMQGRKVPADKWLWTAKLWEQIRDEIKLQI